MSSPADPDDHVRPFVHNTRHTRALHFSIHEVQSFMRVAEPDALALAYTRLMMGFLLFHPQPARIAMLGLGGGSLAKFCHRHLPASGIEVVEINPHVIALRDEFEVPPDDARLSITQGDGARWVRTSPEAFDVLLVDGYDYSGLPSVLATQRFYDDCSASLRPGGLLAVNLFRGHPQHELHLDRLRRSFNDAVLEVEDEERGANSVVLAGPGLASRRALPASVEPAQGMDTSAWDSLATELAHLRTAHERWRLQRPPVRAPRRA
ncbi:spermidine synthase [Sphaerotilus hippei]|uniref:Spermidine synthase n=1 Tax=Sphaerotilus hippei TaxID=744406 RepID=A0A318GWX7_9BURK|nr:fused MFS/spermidine synthase [Sphaerotilus hippei]PXW93888.1 spermidine synthase [Sphaerotilus hippei]